MQLHLHIPTGSVRLAWRLASVWIGLLVLFVISGHGARLQASVAAQEMEEPVHVVAAGETLSEIAQSYDVPMGDVMRLNGISDADAIYVGQHLRIPAALDAITVSEPVDEDTADTEVAANDAANEDTGVEVANAAISTVAITSLNPTYTVRIGDTIPGIALRYDLSVAALRSVNGLAPGDPLRAGQALILPATRDELQFSPAPIRYTVQPGDSLGLIAQQHGTTLNALMTLNRISNPDLIQPGQDLLLPASSSSEPAPQIGPVQSGFYYHTVRAGETPSELAQQFNSTPQALVRYNGLPDVATLYAGLEVRIPYGPPILDRRTPPSPRSGSEFVISISRQRCWVIQGDLVRYEWKCSTGQGEWVTRTGTFFIQSKFDVAKSSAYRLDMPYWLGLYDVGEFENGIHGIPVDWTTGEKLWDSLVGQPATFGCAMLLDEDAVKLYDLAYIGMPVYIVD